MREEQKQFELAMKASMKDTPNPKKKNQLTHTEQIQ
jgi:hypothetical protein